MRNGEEETMRTWKVVSVYFTENRTTIEFEKVHPEDGLVAGSGKNLLGDEMLEALRRWLGV